MMRPHTDKGSQTGAFFDDAGVHKKHGRICSHILRPTAGGQLHAEAKNGWRPTAERASTAPAPAKGHGGARWALGKRAPRARPRAPLNCPTQRNTQRDGRHMADGWLKVGRMPTRRGASTPLKMKGGREGGSAPVNRRRGAGCGGAKDMFIMAKLVGCYSHPRFVPLTPNGTPKQM